MTTTYPKKRKPGDSAAYVLFYYPWDVYIQNMFSMSAAERELLGVRVSGDDAVDTKDAVALVRRRLTIVQLAEYFRLGSKISIVVPSQSIEIYDTIVEHIDNWMARTKYSIHDDNMPTDDLQLLDSLAEAVFAPAKAVIMKTPIVHKRHRWERGNSGMRRGGSRGGTLLNYKPVAVDSGTVNRGGNNRWKTN